MQEDNTKKRKPEDDVMMADDDASVSSRRQGLTSTEAPKRQLNNMLLLNAMRTTAAHLRRPSPLAPSAENPPSETATIQQRLSATPAPPGPSSRVATPKVPQIGPAAQEAAKAPAGAGKKKRKRLCLIYCFYLD